MPRQNKSYFDDPLLTVGEICEYLGISKRTFRRWRNQGDFPGPDLSIGKTLRWHKSTVDRATSRVL